MLKCGSQENIIIRLYSKKLFDSVITSFLEIIGYPIPDSDLLIPFEKSNPSILYEFIDLITGIDEILYLQGELSENRRKFLSLILDISSKFSRFGNSSRLTDNEIRLISELYYESNKSFASKFLSKKETDLLLFR